jgi:hypothetical protein
MKGTAEEMRLAHSSSLEDRNNVGGEILDVVLIGGRQIEVRKESRQSDDSADESWHISTAGSAASDACMTHQDRTRT